MKRAFIIAVSALIAACASHQLESDSKSNWLRDCLTQKDCPSGAACVCGVCTKACENSEACSALSDQRAVCVDPSEQGLPACPSDPVTDSRICLLACQSRAECGSTESCVRGVCISATLVDAGVPSGTTTQDAATTPPLGHPVLDAGSTQVGPFDAGHTTTTTTTPVTNPDPDEDGGLPGCGCPDGILCSIHGACSPGAKILTRSLHQTDEIYAADADYIYGVTQHGGGKGQLTRWPAQGGAGQPMAQGTFFYFGMPRFEFVSAASASTQPPLVVDGQRIYFVAAAAATDLSASLWSMPKDDSAMPTSHGYAGTVLAQDEDFLYFSNDGDSRVLRTGKVTLESSGQREEMYRSVSDAPLTILLLAVNTKSVFVTELPPKAEERFTYTVTSVDRNKNAESVVIGTNDRFTSSAWYTFASDEYFVLGGPEGAARLDLATNEVKPLGQGRSWLRMSFAGRALYGAGGSPDSFWVVDLPTARITTLATSALSVSSSVPIEGAVYAVVSDSTRETALVRIKVKP